MAIKYCDFEGGNDGNDGTSFALRVKTITNGLTAARIAPGDECRIMGSPAPSSLGQTVAWTTKDSTLTLTTALNVLITDCETAWTASANVTCTTDTSFFRTGTRSAEQRIDAGFGTGLVAYFALGGAQNYSAYQGITLWVMVQTVTLSAGTLSIRLCSDAVGVTTVDTLAIPAISLVDCWVPVYINNAGALGSSIQSIALYADVDPGTTVVYLDNISTTKAAGNDCLHLRTLVGKNTADELWWGLREINGTALTIDGMPYNVGGSNYRTGRGYWGSTATVTGYIREVIVAPQSTGVFAAPQESGTAGNLISYLGGWNRTDMSTQTLETWVDGSGSRGQFWWTNNKDFIHVDKIHGVRWLDGLYHESSGIGCTFGSMFMGHCADQGIYLRAGGIAAATELTAYCCIASWTIFSVNDVHVTKARSLSAGLSGGTQVGFSPLTLTRSNIGTLDVHNAAFQGFLVANAGAMCNVKIGTVLISECGSHGIQFIGGYADIHNLHMGTVTLTNNAGSHGLILAGVSGRLIIDTLVSTDHGQYGLGAVILDGGYVTIGSLITSLNFNGGVAIGACTGIVEILASSIAEVTKVSGSTASQTHNPYGRVTFRDYLGVVGDHRSWIGGQSGHGTLTSEATIRHAASGLAWKMSPTNLFIAEYAPLRIPLATIYVNASALVTVRIWMRRSNTGLTGKLFCRGGQLPGVPTDLTVSVTASADIWEQLTMTFTPSRAGTIELEILAYGGTTYSLYFDDFTVAQA